MGRRTAALLLGAVLVLTGFPAGPPDAAAATRCTVTGTTVPTVIDVTSTGTYATVRGCVLARPWTVVTANHVWVDDNRSAYDNTMQPAPANGRWTSAEKLLDRPAYDYSQVIGYNEARVPYRGSGIFRHVHRRCDGWLRLRVGLDSRHAAALAGQHGPDRHPVTPGPDGRSATASTVGSSPRSSACQAAWARSSSVRGRAAVAPVSADRS
jgi:hypothetical protein